MGYAAGLLPPAYDLVVASAVSLDDDARARLSSFEAIGGTLLDDIEVPPLDSHSIQAVMDKIDSDAAPETYGSGYQTRPRAPAPTAVLPQPLRDILGGDIGTLQWRGIGLGVRQIIIAGDAEDQPTARLLSIPAGQAMPEHSHSGTEITLVLKGAFTDGTVRYARGDVEVADDDVEHTPVAEAGSDCICLAVTDAPLRFSALLPRIAQVFLNI